MDFKGFSTDSLCIMRIKSAFLIINFFPLIANGMTCQQKENLKSKYDSAESVLLIEIISTKSDNQKVQNGNVRLNVATYELVESFKGSKTKRGKITEMPGYGTGMVGLIPGMYYVVFLGNETTQLKYPWVNMCNTSYSVFDYTSGGFKEHLDEIRSLEECITIQWAPWVAPLHYAPMRPVVLHHKTRNYQWKK